MGRHDTQHNNTKHNDIQHNNKQNLTVSIAAVMFCWASFYAEVSQIKPFIAECRVALRGYLQSFLGQSYDQNSRKFSLTTQNSTITFFILS